MQKYINHIYDNHPLTLRGVDKDTKEFIQSLLNSSDEDSFKLGLFLMNKELREHDNTEQDNLD